MDFDAGRPAATRKEERPTRFAVAPRGYARRQMRSRARQGQNRNLRIGCLTVSCDTVGGRHSKKQQTVLPRPIHKCRGRIRPGVGAQVSRNLRIA